MGAPLITVDRVDKVFRRRQQAVEALRGVSLDIADGEFVRLLGPSGCGKSTLLRIIGGLHEASGGQVTVAGDSPARARSHKQFGLVPQAPALVPWKTLAANVRFLADLHRGAGAHAPMTDSEIDALLDTVGPRRVRRLVPARAVRRHAAARRRWSGPSPSARRSC